MGRLSDLREIKDSPVYYGALKEIYYYQDKQLYTLIDPYKVMSQKNDAFNQMELEMEAEQSKDFFKIGIFGIENAGKTSILKTLRRQFGELDSLKPTTRVERSFLDILGNKVLVWDYGGQEKYRELYFNSPERFFSGLNYVFYVVDIQDPEMLGSNIMFFEGLFKRIMKHSPSASFILLFHKLDPELVLPENALDVQQHFLDAIGYLFEDNSKEYASFRTSIYNPVTIIRAFSRALIPRDKLTDLISEIMKGFCMNHNLLFGSVVSKDFFELGYYAVDDLDKKYPNTLEAIVNDIIRNVEFWNDPGVKPKEQFGSVGLLHRIYAYQKRDEVLPVMVFIGFDNECKESIEQLEKSLERLTDDLVKILDGVDFETLINAV